MIATWKHAPRELNETSWDVAVVGAGPAGSMTAHGLALRGVRVLLVEQERFPRYKVCGCCLNPRAIAALGASGLGTSGLGTSGLGGLLDDAGAIPVGRFHAGARGSRASIPLPGGAILSRARLDERLARSAVDAGAVFVDGATARLESTSGEESTLRLRVDDTEVRVRAGVVVGAAGLGRSFFGRDSMLFANPTATSRVGAGVAIESAAKDYERGVIYMACAAGGYAGLVRLEDGRLNIAAALDAEFVKASGGLGAAGVSILGEAGFEPVLGLADAPWRGTPLLTRRAPSVAEGRCVTIGDAAGYVEPFTGEGMAWAFECARALAPLVAQAVHEPDMNLAAAWKTAHRSVSARSRLRCQTVARALRHPRLVSTAITAMRVAPIVAKPIVRSLNRPAPVPRGVTP